MKDANALQKLLVLGDRSVRRHELINLGEGAKWDGLYGLLQKNLNFKILSGPWKPFPYLNIQKFPENVSKDELEKLFIKESGKINSFSGRRINFETRVLRFIRKHDFSAHSFVQKFRSKFNRGIVETVAPYFLRRYYARSLISLIQESNLVLFQSDVFADHVKEYMPSFILEILLAKKFGKKVISINQTVDISDPLALNIAILGLKNIDLHLVREPLSREFLLKVGIEDSKIFVTADSAFAMEMSESKEDAVSQRKGIGLLIRGDRNVDTNFWKKVIQIVRDRHKLEVFPIFTCKPQDYRIFKVLGGEEYLHFQKPCGYREFIRLLRNFDLVITDRFHGAVFSIIANTPLIPIEAKSHKMGGLFSMFDYPLGVLNREASNDMNILLDRIDFTLKHREGIRSKLLKVHRDLKNRAVKGMEMIKDFYEKHGQS